MDTKITDVLNELSNGMDRSETAKIRDIFDDIENSLKAGVTRKTVFKALQDNGFDRLTFNGFVGALYRIRKERNVVTGNGHVKEETQQHTTPVLDNKYEGLTLKQRRDAVADKYMNASSTNPLLRKILKDKE